MPAVQRNSIHSNRGLGIELGLGILDLNDAGDADGGADRGQNYPVVSSDSSIVEGMLDSTPNTTFTIELFSNAACDPWARQSATFEDAFDVTTNGSGHTAFIATLSGIVTATATDPAGNTSVLGVFPSRSSTLS